MIMMLSELFLIAYVFCTLVYIIILIKWDRGNF